MIKPDKYKTKTKQTEQQVTDNRPTLIKVGKTFVNPNDVSAVIATRRGLYIVKMISTPDPQFPIWVKSKDILDLLEHFNIEADLELKDLILEDECNG